MINIAIKNFINNLFYGDNDIKDDIRKKLDLVFSENKDIEVLNDENMNITFLGETTKELKKTDDNIILVYKCTEYFLGTSNYLFGFVYKYNDVYIDYKTNLSVCFSGNKKQNKNRFKVTYLAVDPFRKSDVADYDNVQSIVGDETYKLFINFMLTDSKNKLKNAIYKIY